MDRRQFLSVIGAAAAQQALGRRAALKNWAWMRGQVRSWDDWRSLLASMRAAGIDAILIGGGADFYAKAVPVALQAGLELHAWIFTMMRGEHVKTHPEWYAVNRKGVSTADKPPYVDYYRFLCPSRDEVRKHLVAYVRELAQIDGLASVHLDYIRYPDVILPVALWPKYKLVQDKEYPEFDYCYCAVCRDRFKRASGADPMTLADPPANRDWVQFRYDSISEVVNLLADEIRAQKNRVTAAVFPTPSIARSLVRQDWLRWRLDAVLPMVYNGFYKEDVAWIERATREGVDALRGRTPLYSGLYVPDLNPPDLGRAVDRAIAGGAQGVSLFQGNTLTPEHWKEFSAALKRAGRTGVA
jgi:uncharacterized lipoprotein YddW (UPF0748 family)